jgi:F0F1-type ATP synthase assembly protein I
LRAEQELRTTGEQTKGLGLGLTAAYLVVGVPLLFALVGWLIDRSIRSSLWIGILTTIGAVLGITMMVITINRANQDR